MALPPMDILRTQNDAARTMSDMLGTLASRVQGDAATSAAQAQQALEGYIGQLRQLAGAVQSGGQPVEQRALHVAIWGYADHLLGQLQRAQEQLTARVGASEIMQRQMAAFTQTHALLSPAGQVALEEKSIQQIVYERYGVWIEFDADGKPILPEMLDAATEARTRGIGMEVGVERDSPSHEHSVSLDRGGF